MILPLPCLPRPGPQALITNLLYSLILIITVCMCVCVYTMYIYYADSSRLLCNTHNYRIHRLSELCSG